MKENRISVYIVEDYKLSRMCIRQVLIEDGSFDIFGDFESAEEMFECMRKRSSELVVMDIGLNGIDGLKATSFICKNFKNTKVIIYTSHKNRKETHRAFRYGAHGYFLKENNPLLLPLILKSVYNSMVCVDTAVSDSVIGRCTSRMKNKNENFGIDISQLTEEEIEIMRCIASGDSNTVIAKKFMISPNTVKSRVAKLTEKLNAQDRIQVAVIAAKCNLV